ncbi:MAG: hypothetical protein Q8O89_05515 [Nanoarchaeota archaeon]|nr:hypothetical protein [Nanoarchaeota archaeon]
MGETNIITVADLAPQPAVSATPSIHTELKNVNNSLSEIKQLADTVNSILEKVERMRGGGSQGVSSPHGIRDTVVKVEEKIVYQPQPPKPINREKLRTYLFGAIVKAANILPDDIKNKTFGDVIGENFKTLKYELAGLELSSNQILDLITNNVADAIDRLNAEG